MFEVDIFEQSRFCDEFSHPVNKRFLETETHCKGLTSVLDDLNDLLKCLNDHGVVNNR